ncbi:BED zinc finger [Ancylostoma duodenale]|uniref:BED zinc finger n=1 Tax=Ancylostoma duodenale TaxID=51022 RepID=A0A0C2G5J3_9BILA|nr:BED zinc finger [Ancylostoma duodenale]
MSTVWNYYKRMVEAGSNSELAICKFCSKSFNIPKSRTTTNLLEHIRRKHKEEAEESTSTFTGDNDSTNNNQPKLEEMFKQKMNLAVRKKIDRKVVNFIANASVPLNVVAHPSFKDLLGTLNNSYTVPSRASIERLMREEVKCIDESNKKLFADEDVNIAITADSWTSKNASCSLLAITGHALGKDFEDRRNVILDCVPLKEESIHCCAHLVNLAVSASMNYPVSAQALRKVELQQYSIFLSGDEARPDPAEDPIAWWRSHRDRFPLLAKTAPRFLVAPCTSVDTERLFRPSKAWSQRDIESYGNVGDMADVYSTSDDDVEDEEDSSEELE